jgi:hypothetical protein
MNRAIVTISCGDFYRQMAAITHPTIKAYADKLGADFIVWDDYGGHAMPHYQKLELGKLLHQYQRVLYVDTDILVRDDAPDIFAIVPEDSLGALEEGQYYSNRKEWTLHYMQSNGYEPFDWDGRYFNTGVLVLSQAHRDLFVQPPVEIDNFREQTYLNVLFATNRTKIFELPHRFNRVYCMDGYYGEQRFDSYIMHYAGINASLPESEQLELTRADLATWQEHKPAYAFRKSVALVVDGGLAEQIAAEPAVRYAREVLYPADRLVIVAGRPQVFSHLKAPVFLELDQIPELDSFLIKSSAAKRQAEPAMQPPPISAHVVDTVARRLLGRELPEEAKTPRLRVDEKALASLLPELQSNRPEQLVLLHPGRGRESDTFPAEVWQAYADILRGSGLQVAVIGERKADFAVVDFDTAGCLNLVGKLSLPETIALVSKARVLVANDSAATAIAGAFEGWIGLIAPLRNSEHILHHRHGSPLWRAKTLERAARYLGPDNPLAPATAESESRLRESLPAPGQVLEFVRLALADRSR